MCNDLVGHDYERPCNAKDKDCRYKYQEQTYSSREKDFAANRAIVLPPKEVCYQARPIYRR